MIAPLLIWLALQLQAGSATGGAAVGWSDVDGQRWQSVAPYEGVRQSPRWTGVGAPPLSAGAAVASARQVLSRQFAPAERWRLESVTLIQLLEADAWIYQVTFVEPPPANVMWDGSRPTLRLFVLLDGVAVVPVPVAPEPPMPMSRAPANWLEAAVVDGVKRAPVSGIDPALPAVALDDWLRGGAGLRGELRWEINDCGEQTGDPSIDGPRNMPLCVEARVTLDDKRDVVLRFLVGSLRGTIAANAPGFYGGTVIDPTGRHTSIASLSRLTAAVASNR